MTTRNGVVVVLSMVQVHAVIEEITTLYNNWKCIEP